MIYKEIYFGRKQEKTKIDVTQNSNGQTLVFRSMDWEIPSGSSVNIFLNKPDGHLVYNAGTISGNEMSFAMTTQMTAVPGVAEGQVQITTSDDKVLNSFVFDMAIEETIIDGTALESTDEYTALEGLITDATAAIADASDAADDARAAAGEAREPVQVGARNLIVNTLNPSSSAKPKLKGATDVSTSNMTVSYSGGLALTASANNAYYRFASRSSSSMYCFKNSKMYYFRCKYSGSGSFSVGLYGYSGSSWTLYDSESGTAESSEKEMCFLMETDANMTGAYVEIAMATSGASVLFTDIQLEEATVPSQYRPATEDITTPLLAAQSQLNNLVVTESKTITTVGNYYILSDKSGYILANAYRVVNDASGHIKSIAKRSDSGYTLMFDGITTNVTLGIYCVWIKTGA